MPTQANAVARANAIAWADAVAWADAAAGPDAADGPDASFNDGGRVVPSARSDDLTTTSLAQGLVAEPSYR